MQNYIRNLRIEKALGLLKDIRLKVNEIGDIVGIPDTNYFCKTFKKIKGFSPTEYRNTHF
jgi:two-component system response regulator YesN